MRLPDDPSKFTHRFQYTEFGRYVEKAFPQKDGSWRSGVIRDVNKKKDAHGEEIKYTKLYSWKEIYEKVERCKNSGVYTSTFQYDGKVADKAQALSSLYFDLDSKDDINISHQEARRLYMYLQEVVPEEAIRIYFTGMKGFHIECEAITLGIGPSSDLADVFRYIANDLKEKLELTSIDFQVFDPRRMWRIPNSIHQKTGLYKVPLEASELLGDIETITALAEKPRLLEVPEQEFNPRANEWFREYTYEKAKPVLTQEEIIERFARHGTGMVRDVGEMEFDPKALFDHCPSMMRLWKKAETERHLEHEERLFLCSILSYSEQAKDYLHSILQNCDDYNPEKTNAHLNDWVRRRELGIGGRPYSCARANAAGIGCGECNLEAKDRWQVVGDRMVPTGEKASPSPVRFAYRRVKKDV
jgi:hypothetical protein